MKATGLLLLLTFVVTQALADSIFDFDLNTSQHKEGKWDKWLTEEQKAVLTPLMKNPTEMVNKVMEFFHQLPSDEQKKWNEYYRKECVQWLKEVTSDDEISELKKLESSSDKDQLATKVFSYLTRLSGEQMAKVEIWKDQCTALLKGQSSRRRRDLDKNFNDFVAWMTEDQRKEVSDMKASGKSFDDIRKKTTEYFDALPADKQSSLKEEFKGKCKAFFRKIATPEEMEKMKSLHEAGSTDEVRNIVKEVVGRQSGTEKELAGKMEILCSDVFDVKSKRRRDIDEKINRKLSWMSDDQKQVVKQMYADGKPQAEIRAKIFQYLSSLDGPSGAAAKEQTRKECYKWMDDVATPEEIAALHKMHETDHAGCKKKVREFIERLPSDRKEEVLKNLPFCEKVWYGDHDHHDHSHHHGKRRAERRRRHLHAIDKFLDWLTAEQKSQLEEIENSGAHFDNVIAKVKEFYNALPEEKKGELKANFKTQCSAWVKEVATPEEVEHIKKMLESKDNAELKKKLHELEGRLTEEQKHTVEHVREVCLGVWEIQSTRRRRAHDIDEGMTKFLSWLTDEQKEKVKALHASGDREAFYKEILEIFDEASGDVKIDAAERLREACKHYGKDVIGEENINVLKQMKESGASKEAIAAKVEEIVDGISDEEKKATAVRLTKACKKIYGTTRARRDHHHTLEEALQKYLTWLSDDQKEELESLSRGGDKEGVYKKIMEFFQSATGDVKDKAADELKAGCRHYITAYVGEEKAAELRTMKEEGKSVDEIAVKVEEAVEDIADEATRAKAKKAVAACKKIYGAARFRRSHKHSLSEAMNKYLTWLNDDQKSEIESLYAEGNRGAVYEKILEFFDDAEGETKQKAAVELKGACKHYVRDLIGEENGNLIRKMKEEGASNDDIATKVEEMIEAIADDKKKAQAVRASTACKKIYGVARRFRRDHHEHTIDEALEKYLTWLNDDQKAEVKKVYEADGREAAYKKVMEWFEGASGDLKEKAAVELKAACKHYVMDYIGEENAGKIKQMKESGASNEDIAAKINEFIAAISDETKKAKAEKAAVVCRKIYGVARRFRRDHHEHKLEEAMEKYLTWLNDDQKAEVKKLYETGGREEVYKKVMAWFEGASGDVKEKAAVELKAACKHYIKDYIGDENAGKIKELKESGASDQDISAKVMEFIAAISDGEKKAKAEKAAVACKKIYGVTRRFRRDHHEHKLEEAMEKYLTWLNDDQKAEVKKLYETGGREEVYKKVMAWFEGASGDVKEKAAVELKAACKHYIKDYVGKENAEKLKEMKESGASDQDISAKVMEFIAAISDGEKKAKAEKAAVACKKVYGVARRFRRDHHEHKFEEAMEKYLTWLNDDQKAEVKKLYETGGREEVYKKVMAWFEGASGDVKEKAAVELKAACKHYIKDYIGKENAEKLKEMKESGASKEDIASKVGEFIAAITDGEKKAKAEKASAACKKIYGVARRFRRDHHEHNIKEAMEKYLTWLNDDQKAEVKKLYEADGRDAAYKKVMELYEGASGDVKEKATIELKAACKHYIKDYIGEENAEKLKEMKESGASNEEMSAKVMDFIGAIGDEAKKAKAEKAAVVCKKIYGVARRFRRDHHEHTIEEALEKYLTWLNDDQKAEVKKVYEADGREAAYKKVMEWFEGASGDVKEKAGVELKAACKHYVMDYIGEENAGKIKQMKESGASNEDIAAKINEFIAAITDEAKKAKAEKAAVVCRKIYSVARRFRRDHHEHKLEEAMEKYLTWLNDDQKAEVKKVYETGGREEVYKKVMAWFEGASGDVKEKAAVEMKAACKHYIKDYVGKENAEKLKEMKESGASDQDISAKVMEFIAAISDGEKKAKAEKAAVACKKIYGVTRRFRREHHEHKLEEAMEKYLTWLNDDQKAEVKKIYETGGREEVYKKVMAWFEGASGDVKEKAAVELKAACKHYIKDFIGDENAGKIKELKESGASDQDISAKVMEFIAAISDGEKKVKAEKAAVACKKVYGVARRFRRDHHEHKLEEAMEKYLTWLRDEQKAEVKRVYATGDRDSVHHTVMGMFNDAEGDQKQKATIQLRAACKHYIKDYIGKENVTKVKAMKDGGATNEAISAKIDEFIAEMADGERKSQAKRVAQECKKVYGVKMSRARRHYAERRQRYRHLPIDF